MASYFDEHNCDDSNRDEETIDLLTLARMFLQHEGIVEMDFDSLVELKSPPASKKIVEELPRKRFKDKDYNCPICLEHSKGNDIFIELPCRHELHQDCILPWLNNTNSCPICRHELPTDDPEYEEKRLRKAREQDRHYRVKALHSEMFG